MVIQSFMFSISVLIHLLSLSFLALELDCNLSSYKARVITLTLVLYQVVNANYFI